MNLQIANILLHAVISRYFREYLQAPPDDVVKVCALLADLRSTRKLSRKSNGISCHRTRAQLTHAIISSSNSRTSPDYLRDVFLHQGIKSSYTCVSSSENLERSAVGHPIPRLYTEGCTKGLPEKCLGFPTRLKLFQWIVPDIASLQVEFQRREMGAS